MVVKATTRATSIERAQIGELLKEESYYKISLKMGVSECSLRNFHQGLKVTEKISSAIQSYLRRESSIKDDTLLQAVDTLKDISNLIILKGDTVQRETFLDCIEHVRKSLKKGREVSFEKELENIIPCVIKLV